MGVYAVGRRHPYADFFRWLVEERERYQTSKFNYREELEKPIEYWDQQFASYIQRLMVFPMDSQQSLQAALKLAATALAFAEHVRERGVAIPKPGVSSGTFEKWD